VRYVKVVWHCLIRVRIIQ